MRKIVIVLLSVFIFLLLGLLIYRFHSLNSYKKMNQSNQLLIQPSFVLNNQDMVYQGYFSQFNDKSSIKIIAKLIKIEHNDQQNFVIVDLSSDPNDEKLVKILISKADEKLPFILIQQKTRDFDAYSNDYVVTRPDENELIAKLSDYVNQLVLLVIPTQQIDQNKPEFSSIKHLVPIYNKYIDCNVLLFNAIQNQTLDAWNGSCQPRIYQAYVVE